MENLRVIVGKGNLTGQKEISRVISKKGYSVLEVEESWPRDVYVFFNGKTLKRNWPNNYNFFGEGGNMQFSKDFVLVSDSILLDKNIQKQFNGNPSDFENFVINLAENTFKSKVYLAPTDFKSSTPANPHIDLYTLLLPNQHIFLFDKKFGMNSNKEFVYNKIAEEQGFKFIEYDSRKDNVWYGLNNLVLEKDGKEIVFLDSQAKSLISLLEKNDVEAVPIDLLQCSWPAGKIHCQTNVYDPCELEVKELFLE